jgi:hypothetical protein
VKRDTRPWVIAATLLLALATGRPASSHHSFAMFDLSKEQKVAGTIKAFEFMNPHTVTRLMARDEKGEMREWTFEGVSVGVLFKEGWRGDTLKPGDKVTIIFAPLKNGAHGGMFLRAILPSGNVIYNVGLLRGSPGYKPENEAEQRRTITALNAERAANKSTAK